MEKTLRLIYRNAGGRAATISIANPQDELDIEEIGQAMDTLIDTDVFQTAGGSLVQKIRAEVVSRQVDTLIEF